MIAKRFNDAWSKNSFESARQRNLENGDLHAPLLGEGDGGFKLSPTFGLKGKGRLPGNVDEVAKNLVEGHRVGLKGPIRSAMLSRRRFTVDHPRDATYGSWSRQG